MSQDFKDQVSDQPGEALSWSEVWISALTRPSVNTFERILNDPMQPTVGLIFGCLSARWSDTLSLMSSALPSPD
jgi:hypothetical protein